MSRALLSPRTWLLAFLSLAVLLGPLTPFLAPPPASANVERAGDLDPTFSGDGKLTTDFGDNVNRIYNRAHAVAIQPDGKIVAAGYASGASDDFALARYNANGTLDTGFGTGGRVRTDFAGAKDQAHAVALQSDGKIVVVGQAYIGANTTGTQTDFALARYNANGTLDTGFSGDGKATLDFGSVDIAWAVAIDNNGKIVVVGDSEDFALARYNADGTLDTTFSGDGKLTTDFGNSSDLLFAVAVQSDNKIVVAGRGGDVGSYGFVLARYNVNGTLDTGFSGDGKVKTVFDQNATVRALAILDDGKILAVGHHFNGNDQELVMARYNSDGTLDNTFGSTNFGNSGTVVTNFGGTDFWVFGAALQANGKIVVAGVTGTNLNSDFDGGNFGLARYTSSGALDGSFGSGGRVVTDFGHNAVGRAMAIQPDGNIVVAGYSRRSLHQDFALSRYLGRGAPSTDAWLSGLAVTQGPNANAVTEQTVFRPTTFNQYVTGYTALLAADTTHVTVTPTASEVNATISVGAPGAWQQVASGSSSNPIAVADHGTINIVVTAEDGNTRQTYSIRLRPASTDASLTGLRALYFRGSSPELLVIGEFHPDRTSYWAAVPYATGYEDFGVPMAVLVTPTLDLSTSSVTVNGEAVASDGLSSPINLEPGDNVITVRVTAGDGTTTRDYTVTVRRLPPGVTDWSPTLYTKPLGGKWGCRNGVAGAECSDNAVLSDSRFNVNSGGYGHAESTTYRVEELTAERVHQVGGDTQYRIVFTVASDRPVNINRMTLGIENNGEALRLPLPHATRTSQGNTWTWLKWTESSVLEWHRRSAVKVRMHAPTTGLDKVRVYYDSMSNGHPVSGFSRWDIAREKSYDFGYHGLNRFGRAWIAVIPGEFASRAGKSTTTHAKLRLAGTTPGSSIGYAKGAINQPPPEFSYLPLLDDGFTEPIELDPASKNTYVWVKVSHGLQGIPGFTDHTLQEHTHLVIIDPPPRTYTLTPQARATEGAASALTLSLGSPAGAGGVSFTVAADYPVGGATAEDVGRFAAAVTVPEGQRSARVIIPTVDDEAIEEDEERFTVTVAHVGEPAWAVDPAGTDTAVVTIVDNDEPPEGPEPWDIRVVPGDGTLTVTWNVGSRDGVEDSDIWHVLRWSQEFGVWNNPRDPRAVGKNDGLSVDPGLTSYTITDLKNGVATGVFIRSMVGHRNNMSEREGNSSEWVRTKGEHTTPVAGPNAAPTVSSGLSDATIVNESGTQTVSMTGVFADADGDALTITATSSDDAVATASVSADYSTLTVTAKARGTAVIGVNAADGMGGEVWDLFTVTVKAAPVVASAIADVSGLEVEATHEVSMLGVFSDADGDALTITAASSNEGKVTVAVAADQSKLTVAGVGEGTATITVTAQDADGNSVSDSFTITVSAPANNAPTVSTAVADATIVSESGTRQVSLSGVFTDADGDDLTITANSSDENVATVSVSADQSTLTVSAHARGTAIIGVKAADGKGGEVWDLFTVKVKAGPVVASAIADVSELDIDATHEVSMSGVFSDADGDTLTVTQASSSDTSIAAVSAAIDGSTAAITAVTVVARSEGTATITVTARDSDGNTVQDAFDVTVNAAAAQQQQVNHPPTVSSAIPDATIVSESGTHGVSLSGVFDDADGDDLTVTASSSDENTATVSVAADHSTLTVTARARGTATVTVTAADGYGGSVEDSFTVRVKAAPVVASAIADISGLEVDATQDISLSGVFSDPDGDALTVTAASDDDAKATVSLSGDYSKLTVTGVAGGTATITVTAEDADGNRVSDAFDVTVTEDTDSQFYEGEPVPGPVTGLQLTAEGVSLIVSWGAPAPDSGGEARGYIVHLKPEDGGKGRTKTPRAKKTKVTFDNLEAGRTYRVWVRAQNEAGKGERVHATITLPEAEPAQQDQGDQGEQGDGQQQDGQSGQ